MSPTRFIRCLAILALLHQQGACACGCPEHNGWVISVQSLLATEPALTGHEHCDHGDNAPQADATHCDGSADTVYLVSTTPRVIDLPTMCDGTLSAPTFCPVAIHPTMALSSIDVPCLPGSAPSVRAGLGVFLL